MHAPKDGAPLTSSPQAHQLGPAVGSAGGCGPQAAPAGGGVAALHLSPLETSGHDTPPSESGVLPEPTAFQKYTHGGWAEVRRKVFASLVRTGQTKARCDAYHQCCGSPILQYQGTAINEATAFRIVASRCHDRLCTTCAVARSWDLRLALYDQLKDKAHKFATLTLRTTPGEPLKDCLTRLKSSFKRLRHSALWERTVRGGAAFIEITRGKHADHWHTHLHLILDADYMPQKELSYAWHTASGGSYIVDIQAAGGQSAAHYVTKYVTKALTGEMLNTPALLDEFVMAMKGERVCTTFGDWYGKQALEDDEAFEDFSDGGWSTALPLDDAARAAVRGDALFAAAIASTPFGRWLSTRDARGP